MNNINKSYYDFINKFFFYPKKELENNPSDYNIDYIDITLKNDYNQDIHAWFSRNNETNKCILLCHGNAGNISTRVQFLYYLNRLGLSVLFFDYPGFGNSIGSPTEKNCINSGTKFFDYLINEQKIDKNNIIVYGESIGCSIAASIANIYKNKYLILLSGFTNIRDLIPEIISFGTLLYPFIRGFNTVEYLKEREKLNFVDKKLKTLIIHSTDDELISINHGINLAKYATHFFKITGKHSSPVFDMKITKYFINFLDI